ncbi:MAG TPA: endolytic transglycosylase MltG [Acidimicrobiales bacterium]|nr:endolytic transglycosylase MltG [Acidimicrobiales bacterium]
MNDILFDQDHRGMSPDPEPPRRRRPLLMVLTVVAVVVVLGLIGAVLWVKGKIDPGGAPGQEVALTIPEGATTADIAELLADEGVISDAGVFGYYVQFTGGASFQAGDYTLARNSTMSDVVATLDEGPEIAFDQVTVPEGLSLEEVAERVGEVDRFSAERFLELAESGTVRSRYQPDDVDSLEGLLFPDTYRFDQTEDEAALLERMVEQFDTVATEVGYDEDDLPGGLTAYEAIVVASLIESEARVPQDRAKISRVIHNRLEEEMLLQIDATVIYARGGEHRPNGQVLFSDLEVDSPYNTYKFAGLPPTPIAVPGRASLEAAIDPTPGDWLFYVKYQNDGTHAFAETGAEHSRLVAEAKARGVNP